VPKTKGRSAQSRVKRALEFCGLSDAFCQNLDALGARAERAELEREPDAVYAPVLRVATMVVNTGLPQPG